MNYQDVVDFIGHCEIAEFRLIRRECTKRSRVFAEQEAHVKQEVDELRKKWVVAIEQVLMDIPEPLYRRSQHDRDTYDVWFFWLGMRNGYWSKDRRRRTIDVAWREARKAGRNWFRWQESGWASGDD